jgi:hypothetical protein
MGTRGGRLTPVLLLLFMGLAGAASAKRVARPVDPAKPAPKPKDEPKKPVSKSYWEPLVTSGNSWILVPDPQTEPPSQIALTVYDARVVKGVKVARLRWTVSQGATISPMGNSLPTQIALTKKGAYFLTDRLDDAAVTKAVKGKATYTDPPRPVTHDDSYVRKDGDNICIGVGTPPGGKCAAGTCHAEYCLAPGIGITSISGNFTPNAASYKAPEPGAFEASLRSGVPECDQFMIRWYQCLQSMDPAIRAQMLEQLKQAADNFRSVAATAEGKQALAQQCQQILPQMDDIFAGMGCPIGGSPAPAIP